MTVDEVFKFGKHKGKTPRELIRSNCGVYLMWCLDNISGFHLEPDAFEVAVRERYSKQYFAIYKKKCTKRKQFANV